MNKQRREWLRQMVTVMGVPVFVSGAFAHVAEALAESHTVARLKRSKAEWRALLPPQAYQVLFEGKTEAPFTSPLTREMRSGVYVCSACFLPLFSSTTKFNSGTGWPSFYAPISERLRTQPDFQFIVERTEYHCLRCGGHQGHLFDDGPLPTMQRWCNNGVALTFVPEGVALPPLRT
jgi:peptide-methionine (R)-S-oxide reductase